MKSEEDMREKLIEEAKKLREGEYDSETKIEVSRGWEKISIPKKAISKIVEEAKEELKEDLLQEVKEELLEERGELEKLKNAPTIKSLKKVWDNEKDDKVWEQY